MHRNDVTAASRGATVGVLDQPTLGLVRVAAGLPDAEQGVIAGLMEAAVRGGTSAAWLEELVLSAVLFTGFPRALVAAAALRTVVPDLAGEPGDAADYGSWPTWRERGEETCRTIYGAQYEALRRRVRGLHPALDAWIVLDGYGRTLSRPALDLKRRELCAIAMLVPQRVPRQLRSHLLGARHAGATDAEVDAVLEVVARMAVVPGSRAAAARRLWSELRSRP
jgi:4-carboxymuconolactone decarboxylase